MLSANGITSFVTVLICTLCCIADASKFFLRRSTVLQPKDRIFLFFIDIRLITYVSYGRAVGKTGETLCVVFESEIRKPSKIH
jgi:hypothetical protein